MLCRGQDDLTLSSKEKNYQIFCKFTWSFSLWLHKVAVFAIFVIVERMENFCRFRFLSKIFPKVVGAGDDTPLITLSVLKLKFGISITD